MYVHGRVQGSGGGSGVTIPDYSTLDDAYQAIEAGTLVDGDVFDVGGDLYTVTGHYAFRAGTSPALLILDEFSDVFQDLSETTPAASAADPIRVWKDQSPRANDARYVSGTVPTRDTTTLTASSVSFSKGVLRLSKSYIDYVQGEDLEVFVVINSTDSDTNTGWVGRWNVDYAFVVNLTAGSGVEFGDTTRAVDATDPNDGVTRVWGGRFSSSDVEVYRDGVLQASTALTPAAGAPNDTVDIGSYDGSPAQGFTGNMGACIILKGPTTTTERQALVASLLRRFN